LPLFLGGRLRCAVDVNRPARTGKFRLPGISVKCLTLAAGGHSEADQPGLDAGQILPGTRAVFLALCILSPFLFQLGRLFGSFLRLLRCILALFRCRFGGKRYIVAIARAGAETAAADIAFRRGLVRIMDLAAGIFPGVHLGGGYDGHEKQCREEGKTHGASWFGVPAAFAGKR